MYYNITIMSIEHKKESIDDLILDEYVNYTGIVWKLSTINFIKDKKKALKFFKLLQFFLEERILYRYKIKSPPYHSYNPIIDDEELQLVNNFFDNHKKYLIDHNKDIELVPKIDDIKKYFIYVINNKKTIFSETYDDPDTEIKITDDAVIYRKLTIPLDTRLRYLLEKGGPKKFLRMILRYIGYGITGQHCSIPYNVYKYMYDEFNVRCEGFSSPLNSKLIFMKDTIFCTLFKDTDKFCGSQGPFSHKIIIKNQNYNWTVNPPYMPSIMLITYKEIKKAFKKIKRNDMLIIYLMPKWTDDLAYQKFKKSKYLIKYVEPPIGKHYMNCNGRIVHMNDTINCMFFLSKDSNSISDDKINKLIELWGTKEEDTEHQSSFFEPIKGDFSNKH